MPQKKNPEQSEDLDDRDAPALNLTDPDDRDGDPKFDDDDAVDGEFEEEVRAPRSQFSSQSSTAEDDDAIPAEPVKDSATSWIDQFMASLPTDKEVTIIVKRKADHGLRFRVPNATPNLHVENRIWGGETPEEIYDEIARVHGGGRYWFQFRVGPGFGGRSWEATISDPPTLSEKERLALGEKPKSDEQERKAEASPQFAPPPQPAIDPEELFEKELSRMERMQAFFDRMRPPAPAEAPAMSVKDQLMIEAFKRTADHSDLSEQVVRKALSIATDENKTWIDLVYRVPDLITAAGEAIPKVAPVFGPIIGSLFGSAPPKPTMPRMMPPSTINVPVNVPPAAPSEPAISADANAGPKMPTLPADAESVVPEAETQPQAQQTPLPSLKTVEW